MLTELIDKESNVGPGKKKVVEGINGAAIKGGNGEGFVRCGQGSSRHGGGSRFEILQGEAFK